MRLHKKYGLNVELYGLESIFSEAVYELSLKEIHYLSLIIIE